MKKKYNNCVKCGKELSDSEKSRGVNACENCIGKKVHKAKKTGGGVLGLLGLVGLFLFFNDRNK